MIECLIIIIMIIIIIIIRSKGNLATFYGFDPALVLNNPGVP